MPSKSPQQQKLMDAIAAGWHPQHARNTLPSVGVAREYVDADRHTESVPQRKPAFMRPKY